VIAKKGFFFFLLRCVQRFFPLVNLTVARDESFEAIPGGHVIYEHPASSPIPLFPPLSCAGGRGDGCDIEEKNERKKI
jgi:hypothetical protein